MPALGNKTKPAQRAKDSGKGTGTSGIVVPFVRAAHEHVEPSFDVSFTPTTSSQALGPFDVPAYGFLRHMWLLVTTSGGVAGSAALAADAPWSCLDEVTLLDINGAPIYGPTTGYELMLANMFGGYAWAPNPFVTPDANTTGVITFQFALRIPVEIDSWDGYGSLPNQNAAASYKVRLVGGTLANIYSDTTGLTAPAIRVRGYLEAWSQPSDRDLLGNPQEMLPPGSGTTQFWSKYVKTVASGSNTIVLPRVGNLIRTLIMIQRNNSAVRTTTDYPSTPQIRWDARQLINEERTYRRNVMYERYGVIAANFPAGVFVYDFTHDQDGHSGNENRHLWLPTVQATRLELEGSFANAGTLTILTNDVAPAGGR